MSDAEQKPPTPHEAWQATVLAAAERVADAWRAIPEDDAARLLGVA